MPMVLIPLDGGRVISLDKAIVFFGRGAECDIVLKDSRKVSRKHCCVAQIDDYHVVRDLGSMNGVRVNDEMVEGEARLNVGDELWIGDVGFRFQTPESLVERKLSPARPQSRPAIIEQNLPSQDLPVALPEQGIDFEVEATRARKVIRQEEIIEINEDDILE